MPVSTSEIIPKAQVSDAIQQALSALAPDVVRIRYILGSDWTDDPSIFFRVVLSDSASRPNRLHEVADRVEQILNAGIKPEQLGLHAYFNFRNESEQAALNDPGWA